MGYKNPKKIGVLYWHFIKIFEQLCLKMASLKISAIVGFLAVVILAISSSKSVSGGVIFNGPVMCGAECTTTVSSCLKSAGADLMSNSVSSIPTQAIPAVAKCLTDAETCYNNCPNGFVKPVLPTLPSIQV